MITREELNEKYNEWLVKLGYWDETPNFDVTEILENGDECKAPDSTVFRVEKRSDITHYIETMIVTEYCNYIRDEYGDILDFEVLGYDVEFN